MMNSQDRFSPKQIEEVDNLIELHKARRGGLITLLERIQEVLGYLPEDIQRQIADKTGIPQVKILGVITFYSFFVTRPRARHRLQQCMGTACYVKGGKEIAHKIETDYCVRMGESTPDGRFTYEKAHCVGACGLAPVLVVDGKVYGKITPDQIDAILSQYD